MSWPAGRADVVVVGGGHNGLVAATLAARAGRSVVLLERRPALGGASVSERLFAGVDARLSAYSYLVSLFPSELMRTLGVRLELRRREVSSYTPVGDDGLLVSGDLARTEASFRRLTGEADAFARWQVFLAGLERLAAAIAPTLLEPLRPAQALGGPERELWDALRTEPLGALLESALTGDIPRGLALTDGLIGTFSHAHDRSLRQNRCFLYHVIGDGTGLWRLPVGGMGALSGQLAELARAAGAELRTGAEVVAIDADGRDAEVRCADGTRVRCGHVLAGCAPAVLARLLEGGEVTQGTGTEASGAAAESPPEGAQLKVNLLLKRLPRLRDPNVTAAEAFAGTFHVAEGYAELEQAWREADGGQIPARVPCEAYCHSLSDPSILGPELQAVGAQTLTVFALQLPARLFAADHAGTKEAALAATLSSLNSALAEPIEECLWHDADGAPCLEAVTPLELESELAMPGGNIFHRDLSWPFAEHADDVGRWGVETPWPNVLLCGAGARRGGGVSGIPGHNAVRALEA